MNYDEAKKIFQQTNNIEDYISNTLRAYTEELAYKKDLSETKYRAMRDAIFWSKNLVFDCLEDAKKIEKSNGHNQ